ncbi:hypothetical protein Taro_008634 [Colocasia esculenta]|uniref:J domain-containing protein n=1 Tax=Colocasia esculenta TaxID=4460 RepID=A0A843TYQ7_COLES|nr:hypothetical protein [Colocasia esculenta]
MLAGTVGLAATAGGSFLRAWSTTLGCGGCGDSFSRADRPPLRCGRRGILGVIGVGCDDKAGRRVAVCCSDQSTQGVDEGSWMSTDAASPYQILGVEPSCSPAQLKAAFRARVKEFHPDVCRDNKQSDATIRRVIQAYEMLSKHHNSEASEREYSDPFEEPECVAADVFVNEFLCVGKACPYSCVKTAPHAFSFASDSGAARAVSQGHDEDYRVQLAVGQCPRRCIHYVTPLQRAILEEMLQSILYPPYDAAEAAVLDSLIAKANFENNRFRKPKKQPKVSTEYVDWF